MTLKSNLVALLTTLQLGIVGCAGVQQPVDSAPTHEVVQQPRDGRDQFFDYLDANDVQVLGIGEMHLLDSSLEAQARARHIPLTLEIFTNDYLEGLASRRYNIIISEHFFQESMSDIDMFYAGQPIREGSVLDENFYLIPAAAEARAFLHRARELGVRIYPGGFNKDDIQKIEALEGLREVAHLHPDSQAAANRLEQEILVAIAEHTYYHVHNILQVNSDALIITYGGMMHNNTEVRRETLTVARNNEQIALNISFVDEIQQDLARGGGQYREVDIVQRDILDLILQGSHGQRVQQGTTVQQYFFEYILLTRRIHTLGPHFRVNPAQDRLLLVYGQQRRD